MFKKTVRAVAAANRLRSMTRSNTDAAKLSGVVDSAKNASQASNMTASPSSTPPTSVGAVPTQGQVPGQQA